MPLHPHHTIPSLEEVYSILDQHAAATIELLPASTPGASRKRPNLVPLVREISADLVTPSAAYLKLSAHTSKASRAEGDATSSDSYSFLFESASSEQVGRYSFVGAGPRRVIASGPGFGADAAVDPLVGLEAVLGEDLVAHVPQLRLPPMLGGAVGYVGYDCVRYFEPKTARPMKDVLQIPESLFMLYDTLVAFDRYFGTIQIITYLRLPNQDGQASADRETIRGLFAEADARLSELVRVLNAPDTPLPHQAPIVLGHQGTSNIGQSGYEAHVTRLKKHIKAGDIFQCVPSQRIARPTSLHPFNIYRQLRTVNPSPYLFYVDCRDFYLVGASPELLVKTEEEELPTVVGAEESGEEEEEVIAKRVITHPIAGTVERGRTVAEDEALAAELRGSLKDRAEHVMLVDLARNDVNRVGDPLSVRVDRLMVVEKFSHVQHLVSQVSGLLRAGQTRFDAFRSIFPAGTVSGAPKVKAMELIAELEGEKRGVYAGAVGYFGYNGVRLSPRAAADGTRRGCVVEGGMDTCIALRTMLVKDGVAYLQAGGGIVFDSDETDEWVETLNKLRANVACLDAAEKLYHEEQQS